MAAPKFQLVTHIVDMINYFSRNMSPTIRTLKCLQRRLKDVFGAHWMISIEDNPSDEVLRTRLCFKMLDGTFRYDSKDWYLIFRPRGRLARSLEADAVQSIQKELIDPDQLYIVLAHKRIKNAVKPILQLKGKSINASAQQLPKSDPSLLGFTLPC